MNMCALHGQRAVCSNTKHEDYPVQRIGSGVVVAYEGNSFLMKRTTSTDI
jgi:hypothetical protein